MHYFSIDGSETLTKVNYFKTAVFQKSNDSGR